MVDRPPIHLPEILHTCQVLPSAHRRYLQHTGATFISTQALPSAHRRYSFLQHTGASFSTQVLPSAHRRFLQHTGASFSTQALPSAHRRYLQHTGATFSTQALQLREHVFWTCTGASVIIRAIQHNLPVSVQLLPRYVWLLEQPCQTVRKEVWYVVCLAAPTAMLRARGLIFSTLARTGVEPSVVETRAVRLSWLAC